MMPMAPNSESAITKIITWRIAEQIYNAKITALLPRLGEAGRGLTSRDHSFYNLSYSLIDKD